MRSPEMSGCMEGQVSNFRRTDFDEDSKGEITEKFNVAAEPQVDREVQDHDSGESWKITTVKLVDKGDKYKKSTYEVKLKRAA